MNIVLWILQVLLAVVFAAHGWVYATWSASKLEQQHAKLHSGSEPMSLPPAINTFAGIAELYSKRAEFGLLAVLNHARRKVQNLPVRSILGAIGLILPGLTGILTWLTPLAAVGLALVMLGAAVTHLTRRENSSAVLTVVLVALCVFVAYSRWLTIPL